MIMETSYSDNQRLETSEAIASLDELHDRLDNNDELWVFGYGSILWKTGFRYNSKQIGYIDGHVRRFWQGSIVHRGTPQSPGRVATLVPCKEGRVWGVAYQLKGTEMISKALDHLCQRECHHGGYVASVLSFTPAKVGLPQSSCYHPSLSTSASLVVSNTRTSSNERTEDYNRDGKSFSFRVLTFTALADNSLYLGPTDIDRLANEVICSSGTCGHNVEYVLRLATFVRDNFPDDTDEHLFELERKIREQIVEKGTNAEKLISTHPYATSIHTRSDALVQG